MHLSCCLSALLMPADASGTKGVSPKKGSDQPNHVWAGSFLACWSGNDDEEQLPECVAAAGVKKTGVEASDSIRPQAAA